MKPGYRTPQPKLWMGSLGFEPRFTALEAVVIPGYTMTPYTKIVRKRVLNRTSHKALFNAQMIASRMRLFLLAFLALLLLLSSYGSALQAIDAEGLVQQGNYLEQNERAAVYKSLPQTSGDQTYWVVSVTLNDSLKLLVPLNDQDSKLVDKGNLRNDLVSANVLVQRLGIVKGSTQWLISLTTANKLEELANALENEIFDVDVVVNGIESPNATTLRSNIAGLKSKLSTMSSELKDASEQIRELVQEETQLFNVEIDTETVLELESDYLSVYDKIASVKDRASEYDGVVAQFKNSIAQLDDVEAQTKTQLIGLLSPLASNQSITGAISPYASISADNQQRITTEYASLAAKTTNYTAELEKRISRVQAYAAIYSEDTAFKSQTTYSTLEQAAKTILSEQNKPQWKNQSEVNKFSTLWTQVQDQFKKAQYTTAIETAAKAKASARIIKRDGIQVQREEPFNLSSAIITALALILGGFAVILILKNVAKKVQAKEE